MAATCEYSTTCKMAALCTEGAAQADTSEVLKPEDTVECSVPESSDLSQDIDSHQSTLGLFS